MANSVILKTRTYNPRRNLPAKTSRKRGEANFAGAFQRRYVEVVGAQGLGAQHFALAGYGIADFVWLDNPCMENSIDVGSEENLQKQLLKTGLTAFEVKLMDWKKAIQQAYRYSYFADISIVVLPSDRSNAVLPQLNLFKQKDIGLWFFDPKTRNIDKTFTPMRNCPRNSSAKEKAISLFSRKFYLRSFKKELNSIL